MNNLLSNFVNKVQTRQLENLQRKTKKLDVANREYLKNIITNGTEEQEDDDDHHDNNREEEDFVEEDYVLSQRDLDKANIRLEELESKRLFLQTRLHTYQSKIRNAEEFIISNNADNNNSSNISEVRLAMMKEKVKNQKTSLEPVQDFYDQIVDELSAHTSKIESMQLRQLDLKFKTQECNVVLHELSYGTGETTNVVANTIVENDETSELGLIVNNSDNNSDCLLPSDDGHKLVPDITAENVSKKEEEEEVEEVHT